MKILVVANSYPPHHLGGYELGCRDVVEKLHLRGHPVHVLTGDRGMEDSPGIDAEGVERTLRIHDSHIQPGKWKECRKLRSAMERFQPDLVYFWNQGGLCKWLPDYARWMGYRTAFFLSDTNFTSWRYGALLARMALGSHFFAKLVRAIFGRTFMVRGFPVIRGQTCHFASRFLQNHAVKDGIRVSQETSIVVHWGIEPHLFAVAPRERWPVRRLLYTGQVIPQKGVHTAIAALGKPGLESLTLDIAGGGAPDYEKKLHALAQEPGIAGRVNFLGRIPREQMPAVYREHDVLVFPSEWAEPFAITPLEAIIAGMAVVGTTTGGSGELFRDRETAMVFEAGNAEACADAIRQLCADRDLFETIRRNAGREVAAHHTLYGMVDAIEKSLLKIR